MTNTNPRVLILATEWGSGMGPYVASIINSFSGEENVQFLLVEGKDKYFTKNIREDLKSKCTIIETKPQSAIRRLWQLAFDSGYVFSEEIKKNIEADKFETVHILSSFTDYKLAKWIKKRTNLILTVHDLIPHYTKKAFHKVWRQRVVYDQSFKAMQIADTLYTNSKGQFAEMQLKYPNKHYFFSPFPTLVTDTIIKGNQSIPELKDVDRYILFFGRVEAYKGVEILTRAFENANLNRNIKLVIAGKGSISYSVTNSNIRFINRFIDDREIAYLYKRATCVIYPYLSATQSGVLSLALYFNTPLLVSDIPYFREILGDNAQYYFQVNSVDSLSEKLKNFFNNREEYNHRLLAETYRKNYIPDIIKTSLLDMYSGIE